MTDYGFTKEEKELVAQKLLDWVNDGIESGVIHITDQIITKDFSIQFQKILARSVFNNIPENSLVIQGDNWKMIVNSYELAVRIYWRLTGKKMKKFEGFGKAIYWNDMP